MNIQLSAPTQANKATSLGKIQNPELKTLVHVEGSLLWETGQLFRRSSFKQLTERSAVAKSMNVSSDSSPASKTDTDFSPLSSSERKDLIRLLMKSF